jgi:hypothetical protein
VPDILSHFHKIWIFSHFHEVLNNNCHGIPSSGSCADTCGHMDRHSKGNRCFTWLWMHLKVECKVPTVSHVNWGLYYTCINQNRTIVSAEAQHHVSPQCEEKLWKRHTHEQAWLQTLQVDFMYFVQRMYRQARAKEATIMKQWWCKIEHSHSNDFFWNVSLCDWVGRYQYSRFPC